MGEEEGQPEPAPMAGAMWFPAHEALLGSLSKTTPTPRSRAMGPILPMGKLRLRGKLG